MREYDPVIELSDVTVNLGGRDVLRDARWTVGREDHWFVLGCNGSGKTTLMNVIMACVWPRWGAVVRVLGCRLGECDVRALRRRIGWISPGLQERTLGNSGRRLTGLQVALSGFDATIGVFREPTGEEVRQAGEALEAMGCPALADRPFSNLSSGEQMRVLIARALVHRPEILILDEPCAHLDINAREHFLASLDILARSPESPVILFVTHRIEDILPSFTHGLLMRDGLILAADRRERVLNEPMLERTFGLPVRLHRFGGRYWPYIGNPAPEAT